MDSRRCNDHYRQRRYAAKEAIVTNPNGTNVEEISPAFEKISLSREYIPQAYIFFQTFASLGRVVALGARTVIEERRDCTREGREEEGGGGEGDVCTACRYTQLNITNSLKNHTQTRSLVGQLYGDAQ